MRLTKYDERGQIEQLGFAPKFGNAWLYLYGWLNGGKFMSDDGMRCTLNDSRIVEALQWMTDMYNVLGGRAQKVDSFEKAMAFGGITDPFISGKTAMVINGNWALDDIARYRPDMDFGVAPPPAPEGKEPLTWSGGFALVIPRGCKHVEESWALAKWLTSAEGRLYQGKAQIAFNRKVGREYYIPELSCNRRVNNLLFEAFEPANENIGKAQQTFLSLMEVSRYRPVSPVGQLLWDEHARALDLATYNKMGAKKALDAGTRRVQEELDKYLEPPRGRELSWRVVGIMGGLLVIVALYFIVKAARRVMGYSLARR
jgi:multiple sugar transport system permease protein